MAPPLVTPPLLPRLLSASIVLLLAGCSPWWQRQPAGLTDAQQQRCKAVEVERLALVNERQADAKALATLSSESYQPSPAPQAPDPELASRYSQLDREIDDERYANQLADWRLAEQQRHARWTDEQRQRRQRLQQRLKQHSNALSALDPQLRSCPGNN